MHGLLRLLISMGLLLYIMILYLLSIDGESQNHILQMGFLLQCQPFHFWEVATVRYDPNGFVACHFIPNGSRVKF